MRTSGLLLLACAFALAAWPWEQREKKSRDQEREERTQTLELPRQLPSAVAADTRRLVFQVSPLSGRGLLSQQVRDALKALRGRAGGEVVKLRAFVAGSGDVRRVHDLVSEYYTERRQALPALTVTQVGALALEGAQVVFESVAVARKNVNPHGLAFVSGEPAWGEGPLDPVAPLAVRAVENVRRAVAAAGSDARDVVRLTCFLSSLEGLPAMRLPVDRAFPAAARNWVQAQRAPARAVAQCEAIARLRAAPAADLEVRKPAGAGGSRQYSELALVGAPQVVLTGAQAAFGFEEADARLAFERLEKTLEASGSSLRRAAFVSFYPLSAALGAQASKVGADFLAAARPPAAVVLPFEGLPSMDAGFALDVVAVRAPAP